MTETAEDYYVLYAADKLGMPTPAQFSRFLFDSGIFERFDIKACLARLMDAGYVKQNIASEGIVYEITESGKDDLKNSSVALSVPPEKSRELDEKSAEFIKLFAIEQDYPAQYTESANKIVPVFLSIREGQKVLFKISIIVEDVETAKEIAANWTKNADGAYKAVWDCIGGGKPFPSFTPY
jgi:hypothetical protein